MTFRRENRCHIVTRQGHPAAPANRCENATVTLAAAKTALDRGAWQDALDAVDALEGMPPEALEVRATALYAMGDLDGSISAWERLHARRAASGDRAEAARAAVMVAMFMLIDSGLMAPVRGWLGRARNLLEAMDEGPVHALACSVQAYERFFCGDVDMADKLSANAEELGLRHGVTPAVALGRTIRARLLLIDGRIEEGVQALDEVGAFLMSGEVDALTVGMMLCEIICAAQSIAMPEMAREWTTVMERWRQSPEVTTSAIGGVNGRCLVHRAELLRLSGPGDEAEAEALAACNALRPWMQREFGWPLVELGNIRLRRGDFAGAEEAYLAADALAWSPQPGLSRLRLAQGDLAAATELIADAVANPPDLPWKERPPTGDLRLVAFLDAQCEIAHAAGDPEVCTQAATKLAAIAAEHPTRGLTATANVAGARAALLYGDPNLARSLARDAAHAWIELGAPYEAAVARSLAADAAEATGHEATAASDRQAAQAAFAAFGAPVHMAELTEPLDRRVARSEPHPARFRRSGNLRDVSFFGSAFVTPDLVGHRHLARLLAHPGREIAAVDLVIAERGSSADDPAPQLGLPALDDVAREAYRRRLNEVEDDIAEAEANHDVARAELARRDRDFLIAELGRAVGWDGRTRRIGSDHERARMAVHRSIRYAISRLGESSPELAEHLRRAVTTGTSCSYLADPLAPVTWDVD